MTYTYKQLKSSFKHSIDTLSNHKILTIFLVSILIVIIIFSFKNNSIDLFGDNPNSSDQQPTVIDINNSYFVNPGVPTTTNPFTNLKFKLLSDIITKKKLNNQIKYNLDGINNRINYMNDNLGAYMNGDSYDTNFRLYQPVSQPIDQLQELVSQE